MAVGLRVRNSSNILQIDGTYQNLELYATGTITMNLDDNNLGAYAEVACPAGKFSPVLAVKTASEGVFVIRHSASVFRIYVGARVYTKTVTYYLFTESGPVSPGGVGLIVRNENTGAVVYNSNKKYLRVLQPVVGAIAVDGSLSYSFPGKSIAIVQGLRPNYRNITSGGPVGQPVFVITLKSGTMRTPDASTAVLDYRTFITLTGFGSIAPSTDAMGNCNYLIVDVTGY